MAISSYFKILWLTDKALQNGPVFQAFKILITAYLNRAVRVKAKKAGVHDLIEKPFKPEDIEESLSRLLKMNPENVE